jgi:hypothetical protein
MAQQIQLSDGSQCVFGGPGSGKTHWCIENFLANPEYSVYIDYNKAVYRAMAKGEVANIIQDSWVRGPWGQVKKRFLTTLVQKKKVIYAPNDDEDVQDMASSLRTVKEGNLENIENVWIYCDEIDLYSDLKSSVEQLTTKDRGAGIRPVNIVQRPSQVRNRSIVDNSFGGVLIFRVEESEAQTMRLNFALNISEDDLAYIQGTQYAAIYLDRTKFPHTWVRL